MEIIFLGTSSMVPTKKRNHSALLINHGREGILVDCGEGTQRQLRLLGIKPNRITKILISHWHGDHVFGLPGLLQTMGSSECSGVTVYGPKGTKQHYEYMNKAFVAEEKMTIEVVEISKRKFFENEDFYLEALGLEHGMPCLGYSLVEKDKRKIKIDVIKKLGLPEGPLLGSLQRGKDIKWKNTIITPDQATKVVKGRKITVISDTGISSNALELARDSDILICEATYADDLKEKAELYKHLTARQAAQLASRANAKKLILTHFSQRYKNTQQIEEDARVVFDNTECAEDFMKIKL